MPKQTERPAKPKVTIIPGRGVAQTINYLLEDRDDLEWLVAVGRNKNGEIFFYDTGGDIIEDLGTLEYLKERITRAHFGTSRSDGVGSAAVDAVRTHGSSTGRSLPLLRLRQPGEHVRQRARDDPSQSIASGSGKRRPLSVSCTTSKRARTSGRTSGARTAMNGLSRRVGRTHRESEAKPGRHRSEHRVDRSEPVRIELHARLRPRSAEREEASRSQRRSTWVSSARGS